MAGAGYKETVSLEFKGEDNLSAAANSSAESLVELQAKSRQTAEALKELKSQERLVKTFQALSEQVAVADSKMQAARAEVARLADEFSKADAPTDELSRALASAQQQAAMAERSFNQFSAQLDKAGTKAQAAGVDLGKLDTEAAKLTAEINTTETELGQLKTAMKEAGGSTKAAADDAAQAGGKWTELKSKVTLTAAAIAGAVLALRPWFSSASEAEYINEKLAATLERVTGATESEIAALNKQAAALQESTRFSDEETKAGMEKLAHYQLTASQIQTLTPLVLDMAEAKRENAAADADTIGAAEAVGDAMRDGITALESYGVNITDVQEEQFKLADESQRLQMIVEALSGTFGGAAEAAGQTWAGQVDIARNKSTEFLETMGDLITKNQAVQMLLGEVGRAFQSMADYVKQNSADVSSSVTRMAAVAGGAFNALVIAANVVQNAYLGLKTVVAGVGLVVANVWEAMARATGNSEAAQNAKILADVFRNDLATAAEGIAQNNKEIAESAEAARQRWDNYTQSAAESAEQTRTLSAAQTELAGQLGQTEQVTAQTSVSLSEVFDRLGLSFDKLSTGMDETTKNAVSTFGKIIVEVAKTHTSAEDLNRVLGPALQATLNQITTPEAFKALEAEIKAAAESTGTLGSTILGTLMPAMDTQAEKLENSGVYVDEVEGRYARLAEVLGLTSEDLINVGTEAETTAQKLEQSGQKAEEAGAKTRQAVEGSAESARSAGGGLAGFFNGVSAHMYGLSKAAGQAFEANMGRAVAEGVEYYSQKAAESMEAMQNTMQYITTNGISRWMKQTSLAAQQVQTDFYLQSAAVEKYSQALANTEVPSRGLVNAAERAVEQAHLLDDATLSSLMGQINAARAAMDALSDSARSTAQAVSQELANAEGSYREATALEFETRLADLREQLDQARAQGNQAAISDLERAIEDVKKLMEIRLKEAEEREQSERRSSSGSGGGRSSGGRGGSSSFTINVSTGRGRSTVNASTFDNLDDLERASHG